MYSQKEGCCEGLKREKDNKYRIIHMFNSCTSKEVRVKQCYLNTSNWMKIIFGVNLIRFEIVLMKKHQCECLLLSIHLC